MNRLSLFKKSVQGQSNSEANLIGYFGKMPLSDELLTHQLYSPEMISFERRLFESVKVLEKRKQQGIGASLDRMPIVHFLFANHIKKNASTGILFSGKDKSNNPYPFCVFNEIRHSELTNQIAVAPLLVKDFFIKAIEISKMDWSNQTVQNLTLAIESLPLSLVVKDKIELLKMQADVLANIKVGEFWSTLDQFKELRQQMFYLSALHALINMISSKRLSKSVSAIKIPLPNCDDQIPFVMFLIQILNQCLGNSVEQAKYFWYKGNDHYNSSLIFFFRPLSVSGMIGIIDRTANESAILDLNKTIESLTDPTRQAVNLIRELDVDLIETLFRWTQLICPEK